MDKMISGWTITHRLPESVHKPQKEKLQKHGRGHRFWRNRGALTVEVKWERGRVLELTHQSNLKCCALLLLRLELHPHKHWEDSSDQGRIEEQHLHLGCHSTKLFIRTSNKSPEKPKRIQNFQMLTIPKMKFDFKHKERGTGSILREKLQSTLSDPKVGH